MGTNQLWKKILIVVLVIIAILALYPPDQKLKPGLDLAGGTSLIYGIDTEGMDADEVRGIASRMVPIILRRVDPAGVTNVVIRPQGDTRIEIQLPLASRDARERRNAYQAAFDALEEGNINLANVIRSLELDDELRNERFEEFASNPKQRQILDDLAEAFDARRAARQQRDRLLSQIDDYKDKLSELTVNVATLERRVPGWAAKSEQELKEEVRVFVVAGDELGEDGELTEQQAAKKELVLSYVKDYSQWEDVVNDLAANLNDNYEQALSRINELNINVSILADLMDTGQRAEQLAMLKQNFPDRADKIDAFAAAHANYAGVRGRLDDPEDLKRMLRGAGVLEFRILPTVADGSISSDLAQSYISQLETRGPKLASDTNFVWAEIEDPQAFGAQGAITGTFAERPYVLTSNNPAETMLQRQGGRDWRLNRAYPTTDNLGRRAIGFQMNEIGGAMFFDLTNNNIGRPLCILLDGRAISAPNINDAIRGSGIITGRYSAIEQDDMINKLNAGSLPARLSDAPILEKTIGATIGEDHRDRGIKSGIIGVIIVAIFMIFYYRKSGSIADLALVLNILFVLGIMAFSGATFTLPGIAGLILTIGMAVDANVLIFERIREEQESGCSLKMAIANGYSKAFSTIFDANVTTFITALILYMVASEEIKGFAIVLMFGIVSSMFTALFVTRVVFDTLIQKKLIKNQLFMLKILHNPNYNWMGYRKAFFTFSAILIVVGLGVFFSRGSDKYDIEFTGGTSVQINFREGITMERAEVEAKLHEAGERFNSSGLMAARVYSIGDGDNQFEINTTETNRSEIVITFDQPGQTTDSVRSALREFESDEITNISVSEAAEDNSFVITMTQVPDSVIRGLVASAFEEYEFTASDPRVDEIVNMAILDAFDTILEKQENLRPTIVSVSIIDEDAVDETPELLEFLSYLKIKTTLENPVNGQQLRDRFQDLRFKPDMQDLPWYRYELLDENFNRIQPTDTITTFSYVSMHPELGFRQLDDDELEIFKENEQAKVISACEVETSLPRVTQVNPSVGKESQTQAIIAIILSLFAIIGYVWLRFGDASFGLAAIAALVHDVCVTLGAVAICTYIAGTPVGDMLGIRDFKINLEMIAAFLTIIGYSLNDTIVVFDRIRENRGKKGVITAALITKSINQTISRTLLTSFTTFVVVLVMYIWGGVGLRGFTFAMLIGIIIGTYSSIAIASPVLLLGSKGDDNGKLKSKKQK